MKRSHSRWKTAVAAVVLPLLIVISLACGGTDQGDAAQDALDRELDVALQNRDAEPEFMDEPLVEEPEPPPPEPPPPPPPPRPRPQPQPTPPPPPPPAPAPAPPPPPAPVTATAATGTSFRVVLLNELSTNRTQVGQRFDVRVVNPIIDGRTVVVPAGTVIQGRVTKAQSSGGGQPATIEVAFEQLRVGSQFYPISATVIQANPETVSKQGTGEKAAKVGGGAVAGGLLGKILGGGTKSAVIGAIAGAAAGGALVVAGDGQDAVLREGSEMTLRLDQPLTVTILR